MLLKWPKELAGIPHSASIVAKRYQNSPLFHLNGYTNMRLWNLGNSAFAVLGEVQKDLHQAMRIGPDWRQIVGNLPTRFDAVFAEGRTCHNSQLFEKRSEVESGCLIGRLAKLDGGDSLQRENQGAQRFKVLVRR